MTDAAQLRDTLSAFARTLARGYEISDVLHDLTGRVRTLLGLAGAGISLLDHGRLQFVTSDSQRLSELELIQEELEAGPCGEAVRLSAPVLVADVAHIDRRWPRYAEGARARGIIAVAAVPMQASETIGTLDLYDVHPRQWGDEAVRTAQVFADVAASYVRHTSELERERRLNDQLQAALTSRVIIEQAKGIIAAERSVSVDRAFEILRKHANDHNVTLRSVAEAVVRLGLRP
jgi:GAF domain-containing protein